MSKTRKTRTPPASRRRTRLQLEALEDRCLLASSIPIETFDGANLANWTTVLRNLPSANTGFSALAAHDGTAGLRKTDGYEWLVRNDPGAQVGQGQTISAWVQFRTVAEGRAYLGFGATPNNRGDSSSSTSGALSTGRTLSLVLAANTQQLILQNNNGFNHVNLATSTLASPVLPNTWYRLEVDWNGGGSLAGRVFDSTGSGLLGSVSSPNQGTFTGQAGGIALRAFSPSRGEVYFDTITVSGTTAFFSPFEGRTLIPAQTLNSTFNGAASPFLYQSVPGTGLDVGLSRFDSLQQIGALTTIGGVQTVALAGLNESAIFGVLGENHENGWGPPASGLFGSGVPVETPLLQQYVFRLRPGQTTQLIGTSDVKHFFSSAHTDFQHLRPGEKDVYGQGLNSDLRLFSPYEEVDPVTGQIQSLDFLTANNTGGPRNNDGINRNVVAVPGGATQQASTPRLLRVNTADLDPAQNPSGTRWFLAGHLWIVGDQDVTNNTRWLEFVPVRNPTTGNFTFTYPNGTVGNLNARSIPGLANYARVIDDRSTGANPTFGSGFSTTGGFILAQGQGYGLNGPTPGSGTPEAGGPNSVRFAFAGSGSEFATWTFANLQPGTYRVSVTYSEDPNRATNTPFTINGGTPILVNQQLAPNDFSYAGANWRVLNSSFTIAGTSITVQMSNNANSFVIADGVLVERVNSSPTTQIVDNGTAGFTATPGFIAFTGQGFNNTVHFAEMGTGSEVATWTFTNLPPGRYRVSATWSVDPNRATNAPFSIYDGVVSTNTLVARAAVNQELAPNHFSASGANWFNLGGPVALTSGTLVVRLTNQADEYVIADAIRIELLANDTTQIIDNTSGTGFSATAGFFQFYGTGSLAQGFSDRGGVAFAGPGSGSESASWNFSGLTAGSYRVSITYSADPNRATDAAFSVNGSAPILVDQQQAPGDYTYQRASWRDLGVFSITGSTLSVLLSDLANGFVIADAVRIERVA